MDHDMASMFASSAYDPTSPTISLSETLLRAPSTPRSPSSSVEDKKAVKKRKSWGQELPTPKTNLPPRKRAKTDDEKEQRRIERVLRNRAAAQSSRERKRQEVEKLEQEKSAIELQNDLLKQRLLQVELDRTRLQQKIDELAAILKDSGVEVATEVSQTDLMAETKIKQELEEEFRLPQIEAAEATPLTRAWSSVDLAQHPAEMLSFDLQCQSRTPGPSTPSSSTTSATPPSTRSRSRTRPLQHPPATQLLFLTVHSAVYSTILTPLYQLLRSLKRGSSAIKAAGTTPPTALTPMHFTLIRWLTSNPPRPTRTPSTTSSSQTSPLPPTRPSTSARSPFRTRLLRRLLSCNPALARPLKDATAGSLRRKASAHTRGDSVEDVVVSVERKEGVAREWLDADTRSLFTMSLAITQWERDQRRKRRRSADVNARQRILEGGLVEVRSQSHHRSM